MTNKEKVFLFDMDGTLTPAREKIERSVISSLVRLSKHARIGIVTGSDYDYVQQQMAEAFEIGGVPCDRIDILPCNGTKKYEFGRGKDFQIVSSVDMIEEIGQENYNRILRYCSGWQWQIMVENKDLPFTGTFFQYRTSLLNWCPIGRASSARQRSAWVQKDKELKIRERYSELLQAKISEYDINATAALGGSTSFDIYPKGWDKTYALKHYDNHEIWFAGDKCEEGGNDYHLYEALRGVGRSYKVATPADTIALIYKFNNEQ